MGSERTDLCDRVAGCLDRRATLRCGRLREQPLSLGPYGRRSALHQPTGRRVQRRIRIQCLDSKHGSRPYGLRRAAANPTGPPPKPLGELTQPRDLLFFLWLDLAFKPVEDCAHQRNLDVVVVLVVPGAELNAHVPGLGVVPGPGVVRVALGLQLLADDLHQAALARPPVAEHAHRQGQQPGLGQRHDERVDEEIEAEQVDVGLVVRPHGALRSFPDSWITVEPTRDRGKHGSQRRPARPSSRRLLCVAQLYAGTAEAAATSDQVARLTGCLKSTGNAALWMATDIKRAGVPTLPQPRPRPQPPKRPRTEGVSAPT
jgi:hypothetical protein